MNHCLRSCAAFLLIAACGVAVAADAPAAQGIVILSAGASVEVPHDVLSVTLSATREGADAATVQSALKQVLDAALVEARKVAKPGQIDIQTGSFTLFPYTGRTRTISGWQGTAELLVAGRDLQGIAALAGRITSMTTARVGYSLARETREKLEGDLAAQAIARYREKAADYARRFGYGGYSIREVNVSTDEMSAFPASAPRMKSVPPPASDDPVPVEPGRGTLSVTVNGSVQMK
jgi:predicted secreted protein